MDIDFLLRRQAIMEWRDRWFMQAVSTINAAAIKARADFDEALGDAGVADTVWCQTAFKRDPRSASKKDPLADMMGVC